MTAFLQLRHRRIYTEFSVQVKFICPLTKVQARVGQMCPLLVATSCQLILSLSIYLLNFIQLLIIATPSFCSISVSYPLYFASYNIFMHFIVYLYTSIISIIILIFSHYSYLIFQSIVQRFLHLCLPNRRYKLYLYYIGGVLFSKRK